MTIKLITQAEALEILSNEEANFLPFRTSIQQS